MGAARSSGWSTEAAVDSCTTGGRGPQGVLLKHGADYGPAGKTDMPLWNTAGITDEFSV